MTIEDKFYNALDEWNKYRAEYESDIGFKINRTPHTQTHAHSQSPFLHCEGYKTLVTLGPDIFPYIRNQLQGGPQSRYNNEIYRESKLNEIEQEAREIYQRLFKTKNPNFNRLTEQGRKNDKLLLKDPQYNQLLDKRGILEVGDPKTLWCHLISAITPEFENPAKTSFFPDPAYTSYALSWLEQKLGK